MKITAGEFRGRAITQPKAKSVRPMSEKVRAAIFDIIGPVTDMLVLDAYAGSGAAGLEAVSRGATLVEAIEANPQVARVIEQNAKGLSAGENYELWVMTVEKWLASNDQWDKEYDLIIADPPYSKVDAAVLEQLALHLASGGTLVLSHSSKISVPELKSVSLIRTYTYGDSALSVYRSS